MMPKSAGIISMGAVSFLAKEVHKNKCKQLVEYLTRETTIYSEYIKEIEEKSHQGE